MLLWTSSSARWTQDPHEDAAGAKHSSGTRHHVRLVTHDQDEAMTSRPESRCQRRPHRAERRRRRESTSARRPRSSTGCRELEPAGGREVAAAVWEGRTVLRRPRAHAPAEADAAPDDGEPPPGTVAEIVYAGAQTRVLGDLAPDHGSGCPGQRRTRNATVRSRSRIPG